MIAWSVDPQIAERQMQAVIFCLVAFGYIDADFDRRERRFVEGHVDALVADRARGIDDPQARAGVVATWTKHYREVLEEMDRDIQCHFTESVAAGESQHDFVVAKLKLGAYELLQRFSPVDQRAMLTVIDALMLADGQIHPNEQAFRDDLAELLQAPIACVDADGTKVEEGRVAHSDPAQLVPVVPVVDPLRPLEWDFADDPETFAAQASADMDLIARVRSLLEAQRVQGRGRLEKAGSFGAFSDESAFLDGHVYVLPSHPARAVELLVIGDLHGCYSCLKAALMQTDFFGRVARYREAPDRHPVPYLVTLGDYIDRGRFSYAGTLRAVLQLYESYPDHVFMLRGNHEYYVEIKGVVMAPVRPSEAMDSIKSRAPKRVLQAYKDLFEAMPNSLVFDQTMYVHAGIPRDATLEKKWRGIHSLNDPEIRFEMMWSDPSEADVIPDALQKENARFPFGRHQFRRFMQTIGCRHMVRGHERVRAGFKRHDTGDEATLATVFSAGGATNRDLPARSSYREVTPMALQVAYADGISTFTPFEIDYARFNDPSLNGFFAS
ncbi:MAG: metallophosphoesterase family protein [Myxococcota bacterium]